MERTLGCTATRALYTFVQTPCVKGAGNQTTSSSLALLAFGHVQCELQTESVVSRTDQDAIGPSLCLACCSRLGEKRSLSPSSRFLLVLKLQLLRTSVNFTANVNHCTCHMTTRTPLALSNSSRAHVNRARVSRPLCNTSSAKRSVFETIIERYYINFGSLKKRTEQSIIPQLSQESSKLHSLAISPSEEHSEQAWYNK